MATIYNSLLTKELIEGARVQVSRDSVPTQIADKVVPVMEVNPSMLRKNTILRGSSRTTTGTLTIYTTPTDRDFYLTSLSLSIIKDVTCDLATGSSAPSCTIDGASQNLPGFSTITTTAQNQTLTINFDKPIKLDKNSSIVWGGTFTAGVYIRYGVITGYIIENSNS